MLSLATLPYDTIHAIIRLLDSHDALSLALTSRYCHDLAINQVSTFVNCTSSGKLSAAWETLVENHPERARHVHTVVFGDCVESDREYSGSTEIDEARSIKKWDLRCNSIRDILLHAQATSHIFIRGGTIMKDMRIFAALQALKHLVHLDVYDGYGREMFAAVGALRSPLQVLSLCADEYTMMGSVPILEALLSIAPHKSSLRALRLKGPIYFPTANTVEAAESLDQLPCFPLCHRLILIHFDNTYKFIDIFAAFPNLEAVDFPYDWHSEVLDKIPPLRYLSLHPLPRNYPHHYSPQWRVRFLDYAQAILLGGENTSDQLQQLFDRVREVSPVALYLSVQMLYAVDGMASLFDTLAIVAPKLKYLDLKYKLRNLYSSVPFEEHDKETALWIGRLSARVATSPALRCLRIVIDVRETWGISVYSRPWFRGEKPPEHRRLVADAILALPHRIATEIPTLRFLAISTQAYYDDTVWFTEESYYDLHALDADVTWWRIEREEGDSVLHRMGTVEGTRVWKSLIENDEEGFRFEACS